MPLDPLQQSPTSEWPGIDDDGPIAWQPGVVAPAPIVVSTPPAESPPPWQPTAAVALVREVQRITTTAPVTRPAGRPNFRDGVKTYRPFG